MKISRRAFGLGLLGSAGLLAVGVPGTLAMLDEDRLLIAATEALFPPTNGLPSATEVGVPERVRAYLAHLPQDVAWQARGLFRVVEASTWPTHGARFSALPLDERTAVLDAMAGSDLAPRRLMAHSLKQLCAMGYWQHPRTWAHVGYDGPWVDR